MKHTQLPINSSYLLKPQHHDLIKNIDEFVYHLLSTSFLWERCSGCPWGIENLNLFFIHDRPGHLSCHSIAYVPSTNHYYDKKSGGIDENGIELDMEELYYYLQLASKVSQFYEDDPQIRKAWQEGLEYFRKTCHIQGIYQDRLPDVLMETPESE